MRSQLYGLAFSTPDQRVFVYAAHAEDFPGACRRILDGDVTERVTFTWRRSSTLLAVELFGSAYDPQ